MHTSFDAPELLVVCLASACMASTAAVKSKVWLHQFTSTADDGDSDIQGNQQYIRPEVRLRPMTDSRPEASQMIRYKLRASFYTSSSTTGN